MRQIFATLLRVLLSALNSRSELVLENLALRQQLTVLQRTAPKPRLNVVDRLFWVVLRNVFNGWREVLLLVQPQTVLKWHRLGFRYSGAGNPEPNAVVLRPIGSSLGSSNACGQQIQLGVAGASKPNSSSWTFTYRIRRFGSTGPSADAPRPPGERSSRVT
jgi:hypothetical protein